MHTNVPAEPNQDEPLNPHQGAEAEDREAHDDNQIAAQSAGALPDDGNTPPTGSPGGISAAKLAANRANAQKSTGPRTALGKANSRGNAVRHYLFTTEPLLPGKFLARLQELRPALFDDLKPVGATEELLVSNIAVGYWRIERLISFEHATVLVQQDQRTPTTANLSAREEQTANAALGIPLGDDLHTVLRYFATFNRQLERDLNLLLKLQAARKKAEAEEAAGEEDVQTGPEV